MLKTSKQRKNYVLGLIFRFLNWFKVLPRNETKPKAQSGAEVYQSSRLDRSVRDK
jgi:hypothetical protein